ncbi:MAG: hypothetical protein AB7V08_00390 [Elusimicrobiales bacterium]
MKFLDLSFELIDLGAVFLFLFLALALVATFICLGVFQEKRFRYALPISNAVVVILIGIIRIQNNDALADMIWSIPLTIDFALYPLLPLLGWICGAFQSRIVCPLLMFLFAGSFQYYWIGRLIDYLWGKIFPKG